jgi:thiosulfate/3-mercaptopyruvate sulfurtransferase
MRHHILVTVLGVACLAAGPVTSAAQPVGAPSIATPQQAAALLDQPGIVVLHIGERAEYDKEHLPRARHLELRTLYPPPEAGQLTLQLPPAAELESRLEALGIGDTTPVLVYMGKDWVSPTTRVVFTLDYAGLGGQTFVMDGGLPAWKAARLPVTSDVPAAPTPGSLTIKPRTTSVADLGAVKSTAGAAGHLVIDARATEFYTGQNNGNGRIPRPGHVAGAVSLPYTSFVREDGTFKPATEVEAMLKAAGAAPGTRITTYCHIGQQATVPWLMARILGYDVKLFDGSYEEWSRADAESAPVKTGAAP